MQKTETKNSKAKDVFDKVKTDVRLYKEELNGIERNHGPKERFLGQLKASPESMQTSKEGLESELIQAGHFIMTTSQLSYFRKNLIFYRWPRHPIFNHLVSGFGPPLGLASILIKNPPYCSLCSCPPPSPKLTTTYESLMPRTSPIKVASFMDIPSSICIWYNLFCVTNTFLPSSIPVIWINVLLIISLYGRYLALENCCFTFCNFADECDEWFCKSSFLPAAKQRRSRRGESPSREKSRILEDMA